jgi:hypothetical protein
VLAIISKLGGGDNSILWLSFAQQKGFENTPTNNYVSQRDFFTLYPFAQHVSKPEPGPLQLLATTEL